MRVWDVHPGYLSRQSLLGQHAEIHALFSILTGGKKGYASHPETRRWARHLDLLKTRHDGTVKEMGLRGFGHGSPLAAAPAGDRDKLTFVDPPGRQFALLKEKYARRNQAGRIPLPRNGSAIWAQHKYSIMARGYQYYREMSQFLKGRPDIPVEEDDLLLQKILEYMNKKPTEKGLRNLADHLWGYFKTSGSPGERETFARLKDSSPFGAQLDFLYNLAVKYNREYLLHSTVFADLTD